MNALQIAKKNARAWARKEAEKELRNAKNNVLPPN